jgi:hypothetical protein
MEEFITSDKVLNILILREILRLQYEIGVKRNDE